MKDMTITSEEKKDRSQHSIVCDEPQYPYGLKLRFDPESYKKLGMSEPPKIGAKVMVMGYGKVCEVEQHEYEGDVPKTSIEIQLMGVEVKSKESEESAEKKDTANEFYKES
jgi:hypothetical protein